MVQLKYKRAKAIKVFLLGSLYAQSALGMSQFSFKAPNVRIFKVLNLRKGNFNRLALWYLTLVFIFFPDNFRKNVQLSVELLSCLPEN